MAAMISWEEYMVWERVWWEVNTVWVMTFRLHTRAAMDLSLLTT